jgi:hypothetical protein
MWKHLLHIWQVLGSIFSLKVGYPDIFSFFMHEVETVVLSNTHRREERRGEEKRREDKRRQEKTREEKRREERREYVTISVVNHEEERFGSHRCGVIILN